MLNREYQIRATRQAMRSRGAHDLYRPAPLLESRPMLERAGTLRPLEDVFPMAYEEPEQLGLFGFDGTEF